MKAACQGCKASDFSGLLPVLHRMGPAGLTPIGSFRRLQESWHNNHHAFPSSARHGLEWWQVSLAGHVRPGKARASGLACLLAAQNTIQGQVMLTATICCRMHALRTGVGCSLVSRVSPQLLQVDIAWWVIRAMQVGKPLLPQLITSLRM